MGPAVARVSAPRMTPFLNLTPTIVVPVDVCRGSANPFCVKARFLHVNTAYEKSLPLVVVEFESRFRITEGRHCLRWKLAVEREDVLRGLRGRRS